MTDVISGSLEEQVAALTRELANLRAELAVHRGALVWTMGVHQLAPDDRNPHRAVLEPLGLDLSFEWIGSLPTDLDPETVRRKAEKFVEDAERVFRSRQAAR